MDAPALIFGAYGSALRLLSGKAGVHYSGLAAASRAFRQRLSSRSRRSLLNLHVTAPAEAETLQDIEREIATTREHQKTEEADNTVRLGGGKQLEGSAISFVAHGFAVKDVGVAAGKVAQVVAAELKHEKEQYKLAEDIQSFLKSSPFKLMEIAGDVNMSIEREVGDKVVRIDWQLTSSFPEVDQATELSITVDSKRSSSGLIFYCSTTRGEDQRYIMSNFKSLASAEERESSSRYHGPKFEDLGRRLREALDEYLAELGMGNAICDFVDAMAVDKDQREYIRWLEFAKAFVD